MQALELEWSGEGMKHFDAEPRHEILNTTGEKRVFSLLPFHNAESE
jgi:hypothetical protein